MHAKKIQTSFGRKIYEAGFVPERGHLGSFWDKGKPLFERVDIDPDGLDDLPEGTILRVNRETFDRHPFYFRKELSETGETWVLLHKEGETPLTDRSVVSSRWFGFEHAAELMIIYTPED